MLAKEIGGYAVSKNTGLLVSPNPDTLLGPDLMFFTPARRLEELSDSFCVEIPRLLVEVLAGYDTWGGMCRRVRQYLDRGVPQIWVVDPESQTVSVFRPGETHRVLDRGDLLPDVKRPVADLFNLHGATAP